VKTIVLVQLVDGRLVGQLNKMARGYEGQPLSPLMVAQALRELAAIAPFRCTCGCGQVVNVERYTRLLERRATLQ